MEHYNGPAGAVGGGQSDIIGGQKPLEAINDPSGCNKGNDGGAGQGPVGKTKSFAKSLENSIPVRDSIPPGKVPERRKSQVRFATPEQLVVIPLSTPEPRGVNSCNAGKFISRCPTITLSTFIYFSFKDLPPVLHKTPVRMVPKNKTIEAQLLTPSMPTHVLSVLHTATEPTFLVHPLSLRGRVTN